MSVAVVGAGLAGLAAADGLIERGVEPTVLEARDRVGGRVHSRELPNGAVVEMGAEFILPGCSEVIGAARRFGLGLWDKGMRYGSREPRGVDVGRAALADAASLIDSALADGPPAESAASLLARLELDPGARRAILARTEVSAAAPAEEVPAEELGVVARLSDAPSPGIDGGNGRLAQALAEQLAGRVHLGAPVRSIAWSGRGVTVRTDAAEVGADACVVTVPATVLDRIDFDPALPAQVADALAHVRYGHAAKLLVPLRVPAPPSATLSVPERFWAWTATDASGGPHPAVSAFAGSPPALERLELGAGPGRWLDALAALRPDLALDRSGALLSTWDDDPWVEAAYSLAPAPAVLATLRAPVGPLVFAGEHLGGEFGGLMEGALRSGRRAAEAAAGLTP